MKRFLGAMASHPRKSIRVLQETIRMKRIHMGLPPEGELDVTSLVAALKAQPPMDELIAYVKNALNDDGFTPREAPPSSPPKKPFDKMA